MPPISRRLDGFWKLALAFSLGFASAWYSARLLAARQEELLVTDLRGTIPRETIIKATATRCQRYA